MIRLAYHLGRYFADVGNEKPGLMLIYNGGSYFNNDEVPLIMQKWIFEKVVNKYPSIRNILVESRPEFIKAEKLEEMKSIMGRKCSLSVAIGLECQSDEIRKHSINKGFSKHDYNRAVELLKGFGVHVMTYVFLKPLMLTEREAIREAIATIKYAFAHKSDSVALQAAFIQEGTVMCRFYKDGKFSLPWLWSIIAVVKKCANLGPIHIGSFHDEPSPIAVPYNCSNCNDRGMELIAVYNKTHDVSVFDGLSCKCRKLWEKEVKKATPPRSGRLLSVL